MAEIVGTDLGEFRIIGRNVATGKRITQTVWLAMDDQGVGASVEERLRSTAEVISTAWRTRVLPHLPTGYMFDAIRWRDRRPDNEGLHGYVTSGNGTIGTLAGATLPGEVAAVAHKIINGTAGQRSAPMYLSPLREADVLDSGLLTVSYSNNLNGGLTTFHTDINVDSATVLRVSVVPQHTPGSNPPLWFGVPTQRFGLSTYTTVVRGRGLRRR